MKTRVSEAIEVLIAEQKKQQAQLQKENESHFRRYMQHTKPDYKALEKQLAKLPGMNSGKLDPAMMEQRHEAWIKKVEEEFLKIHKGHKKPPAILTNYPFPVPMPDSDAPVKQDACFFPADSCWGDNCEANKAALHPDISSSGVGQPFGVYGYAQQPPSVHTLNYGFIPPAGGFVGVLAQVVLNGFLEVHSELGNDALNYIYQHANADARLILRLQAMQYNRMLDSSAVEVTSLHANPGNSRKEEFHNQSVTLSLSRVDVSAGEPVIIQVIAEAYATGQSVFAHATVNFAGRIGNSIAVPQLCYFFREVIYKAY